MSSGVTFSSVVCTPRSLKSGLASARTTGINTAMYSGLHPAITALMAIFSTVTSPLRGSSSAITVSFDTSTAASMASTRPTVGGTIGKPSCPPPLVKALIHRGLGICIAIDLNALAGKLTGQWQLVLQTVFVYAHFKGVVDPSPGALLAIRPTNCLPAEPPSVRSSP